MHKKNLVYVSVMVLALLMSPAMGLTQENADVVQKATFAIDGMNCGGCVGAVKVQLKRTPGVTHYNVSYEEAEAVVTFDPKVTDPATIAESITKSGFKATVKEG